VSPVAVRSQVAEHLDALGRPALIGYLPVGYPSVDGSVTAVRTMIDAGADVVELGVPYSDPVMDGPVIQRAVDAALAGGTRVGDTIRAVEQVAGRGAPVLVMTYWNLVLRYGVDAFARDLAAAGGAGLITPDLIPDEAAEWIAASDAHGLDRVFLVAPSSTPERLASTAAASRGFVYAASTMGVTGERTTLGDRAEQLVADTRAAGAAHVCVGLGVSRPEQATQVARYADGVIVGSALVRAMLDAPDETAALDGLARITSALADGVRSAR
jgi:tryptophan synthase alpha chain